MRLEWIDLALIGGVGLFALRFLYDLAQWRASAASAAATSTVAATGSVMSTMLLDVVSWTSDPLLAILLLEAILIRRAAVRMGAGYLSQLLGAIFIRRDAARGLAAATSRAAGARSPPGSSLTSLGDIGFWALANGHIVWPWSSAILVHLATSPTPRSPWAPAWQVVACRTARPLRGAAPAGAPIDLRPLVAS